MVIFCIIKNILLLKMIHHPFNNISFFTFSHAENKNFKTVYKKSLYAMHKIVR